jgi:hypothetical protein
MKQMMLGMMAAMMPFMMPLVWLGAGLVIAGFAFLVLGLVIGRGGVLHRGVAWASALSLLLGAFFLLSQFIGMWLGATPAINLGDSRQYQFILVPFWQVGLALLVLGAIIWRLGRA